MLALSLSAVQWLPGIAAISSSQRSALGTSFAGSGSFSPANSLLSLVPYLFGGYGHLGEATFFSHYNLPEVGIYVGILPIIALFTIWRPQWPSRLAPRERRTWYLIALIGLLLAFGANTPLEHVFNAIPLYGHQRLQSRNMIDVSFAICVLFAGWLDRREDSGRASVTFDRWAGFIPFGVVLGVSGWAAVAPRSLVTSLTTASGSAAEVHTVREASLIALGFCLLAGVVTWLRSDMRRGPWFAVVAAFMAADLGLIAGTSSLVTVPSNALLAGTTVVENYVAAHLTPGGASRSTIRRVIPAGRPTADTGRPDDNILARLPSVGGYASIVNGSYNAATLTHSQGELNVPRLASGAFAQLDLQDILTTPEYFLVPLAGAPTDWGRSVRRPRRGARTPCCPLATRPTSPTAGTPSSRHREVRSRAGQSNGWFFGESLVSSRAALLLAPGATAARIRFGTVNSDGEDDVGTAGRRGPGRAACREPSARGLGRRAGRPRRLRSSSAAPGGHRGGNEDLRAGWRALRCRPTRRMAPAGLRRPVHPLCADRTRRAPSMRSRGASEAPPAIDVLAQSDNAETIRVRTASPVVVVRDVAWDGGWRASVSSDGGPQVTVPVDKRGLVQQVSLPSGTDSSASRISHAIGSWPACSAWERQHSCSRSSSTSHSVVGRAVGADRVWHSVRSAVGVGQREEELPFLGPPHAVDHEARGAQLLLDPLGGELGTDLGQQSPRPRRNARRSRPRAARRRRAPGPATASRSTARPSFHSATWANRSGSKSPPSCSLRTWRTFLLNCAVTPAASS